MSQLVRSKIGPFQIANAVGPDSVGPANLPALLLPVESAVQELPAIQLTEEEVRFLRRGQAIVRPNHQLSSDTAAFDDRKKLVAVVIPQDAGRMRPEKVLPEQ
jgi:tRNA U55 pseudouridine synthase TruB